jgi:DNA-binding Lrp family transcriptional regulator
MPKHSDLPERIISILVAKPSTPRKEISKQLGVSYQSVQKHLLKMENDGVVTPSFTVDEAKIKKQTMFWVFINTKNPDENRGRPKKGLEHHQHDDLGNDYQRGLCREIEDSFLVESDLMSGLVFGGVHIVLGGVHDIILRLYSDDPNSVGNYVTRFLRTRPAVVSTSTAWVLLNKTSEKKKVSA